MHNYLGIFLKEMKQNVHIAILCLTHRCNLNCIYCFEQKDCKHELSFDVACKCVDEIIDTYCVSNNNAVNLNFFGGEPLLKFELIKDIYNYVQARYPTCDVSFFASTNGTLLTNEMKVWFSERKDRFCLGLSLDGDRDTQNYNRSNSFDRIDIKYFADNWPTQSFKLTISEYSVQNYAHNVIFIHSFGVGINGGDICVGNYHWDNETYLSFFAKQLRLLVDFYVEHPEYKNNLFDVDLALYASERGNRKSCGCGSSISYYETDGMKYPCTFLAPMAFPPNDIKEILKTDFNDAAQFTDISCKDTCLIYNICHSCAAENYMINGTFSRYNKRNCGIKKIVALAIAELQGRRIINHSVSFENEDRLFYTIEAIKKIREEYLPIYGKYFKEDVENPEESRHD